MKQQTDKTGKPREVDAQAELSWSWEIGYCTLRWWMVMVMVVVVEEVHHVHPHGIPIRKPLTEMDDTEDLGGGGGRGLFVLELLLKKGEKVPP